MMTPLVFEITQADLDTLDSDTFDVVWMALGLMLRSRGNAGKAAAALEAVESLTAMGAAMTAPDPVPLKPQPVAGYICPECGMDAHGGAGLAAHRRSKHPGKPNRTNGKPMIDAAKAREQEAVLATVEAIRAREPQPHTNGASAFEAKAAARHAATWAERHAETA